MNPLVLTRDGLDGIAVGLRWTSSVDYLKLVANTGQSIVVPDNALHALFSCTTDFFVRYAAGSITSAVYASSTKTPSGGGTGTALELNPVLRTLTSVTGLTVIAKAAGDLSISWFAGIDAT